MTPDLGSGRRPFPQETNPDAGRLLGIVFEAVEPLGVVERDLEHGVACERQRSSTCQRTTVNNATKAPRGRKRSNDEIAKHIRRLARYRRSRKRMLH